MPAPHSPRRRPRPPRCALLALGTLLVVSAPLSTAAPQDPAPYPKLSPRQPQGVLQEEVTIPMRDGVGIAATIVRPAAPGRYPVVLRYWPYGKTPDRYFAERGYVAVFAEGRGVGSSDGVMRDYFDAQSFRDGYDIVEWTATQPWSTGKVGMVGISYGAINATRVAALRPPHLAAISVNSSYANFYGDHWFPGGVRTNHPFIWHGVPNMLATMLRGPVYDDGKGGAVVDVDRWKRHVAENRWKEFFPPQWTHVTYDEYWKEKDLRSKYADFAIPTLQVGNYFDHSRNHDEVYQNYLVLKAKKVPQKLIVGPWTHGGFGPAHVVDFDVTTLAWFDRFLKGIDNGIDKEPPVSVFVMRENAWRAEDDWPIARTVPTKLHLDGEGRLTTATPSSVTPRRFTHRPWVGSAAGPYGTWFYAEYDDYIKLPDQRVDEAESLTFTSEPLTEDMEVTGMPAISFVATSTASNTDFTIKLSDVSASGHSALVTRGWINSSYRESNVNPRRPEDWKVVTPSEIVPGTPYRYAVTLQNVSYLFRKGQRIRVTISSSDWPSNWPNPNAAENELRFEDGGRLGVSAIELPVVPRRGAPLAPPRLAMRPSPPAPRPAPTGERIWIEHDLTGNAVAYRSEEKGERPLPGGGTMRTHEAWRIDLTKSPPYTQVIDYTMTYVIVRPGSDDVRFVYRVRTDDKGPKATVEWSGATIQ